MFYCNKMAPEVHLTISALAVTLNFELTIYGGAVFWAFRVL